MNLLIVESPGKIKKIRSILKEGWNVAASVGHVRDLPLRTMGVRPPDFKPAYVETDRGRMVVLELKRKAGDSDEVFLATDPDREGEAIAWHVAEVLGLENPKRVVYDEITESAITKAIENPRPIDMNLVRAQEGRRVLDRLFGYGVSPALKNVSGRNLTAGRVQSPAVRLVVERERAIRNHVSVTHYGVELWFGGKKGDPGAWSARLNVKSFLPGDNPRLTDKALAEKLVSTEPLRVVSAHSGEHGRAPAPPFTTSSLQQAASSNLKTDPAETMALAQRLYECGHITYMRTDNPNISEEAVREIAELAKKKGWPLPEKPRVFKAGETAQEAHEAIRPTRPEVEGAGETPKEKALYKLIRERALASQLESALYATTRATLARVSDPIPEIPENAGGLPGASGEGETESEGDRDDSGVPGEGEGEDKGEGEGEEKREDKGKGEGAAAGGKPRTPTFEARGKKLVRPGYKAIFPNDFAAEDATADPDLDNPVPILAAGEIATPRHAELKTKKTMPPPRYTQASLIRELEKKGIGRPSTYAAIMANIGSRNYVTSTPGRRLAATPEGETLVDYLRGSFGFLEYNFTKKLELSLDDIALGRDEYLRVVREANAKLEGEIRDFLLEKGKDGTPCPRCAWPLEHLKKAPANGSRGYDFWKCPNPECGSLYEDLRGAPDPGSGSRSILTDQACPKCGSPMRHLFREADGRGGNRAFDHWKCTKENCMSQYEDSGGKPNPRAPRGAQFNEASGVKCPVCESELRHLRKETTDTEKGYNYWKCPKASCGAFFDDVGGAEPDFGSRRHSVVTDKTCRFCKSVLKHVFRDLDAGGRGKFNYWLCTDRTCRTTYPDFEGNPDFDNPTRPDETERKCPDCGEVLRHMLREDPDPKNSYNYWRCQNTACGTLWDDGPNGPDPGTMRKSVLTDRLCPNCDKYLKHNTKAPDMEGKGGYNYWACSNKSCKSYFNDDGGEPDFDSPYRRFPQSGGETDEKCPGCGAPLTHYQREADDNSKGYDYWKCSDDVNCGRAYEDKGGKPDPEHFRISLSTAETCPKCGQFLKHHSRKESERGRAYDFWACSDRDCPVTLRDKNGSPDYEAYRRLAEAPEIPCPDCGKPLVHMFRESSEGKDDGFDYWKCPTPECGTLFDDDNGSPDMTSIRKSALTTVKCPKCSSFLRHLHRDPSPSRKGYDYWKCSNRECGASFEDDVSGPGEEKKSARVTLSDHLCPTCGKPMKHIVKEADSKSDGYDFWGCSGYPECRVTLPDNNGVPGERGSGFSSGGVSEFKCPRCETHLIHKQGVSAKTGNDYDFFSCPNPECRSTYGNHNGKPYFPSDSNKN
ncbi:MAG: topoisomerase DNA-binding C4 zinc finger domain-containing protein [Deltaproteobacteria bacterium]|jgi:DNA topoisomerase-1|nr:topoisomerase DNA-binding C4 zinc finger domain-containing protein [Deltaproteobacteria bacterium]